MDGSRKALDFSVGMTEAKDAALLDRIVEAVEPHRGVDLGVLVGECLSAPDARRPAGARVRWQEGLGRQLEEWLPVVQGLPVREGDRVLLVRPTNWSGWLVLAVVNGFERRPEAALAPVRSLELRQDECLRVATTDGQPVAEIQAARGGPRVRLLTGDISLEFEGRLKIKAREIDLQADGGDVRLKANDSIVAQGEIVKLN